LKLRELLGAEFQRIPSGRPLFKEFFVNVSYMGIALIIGRRYWIHHWFVLPTITSYFLEFGAVSWMPSMVSISIIREIGPIITRLICAGPFSGIGAELGSMRVTGTNLTEVSGTNCSNLVVTRIITTFNAPLTCLF
jgi:phospholipid/cholesterol/gamma-HCH transport system permease protein